MNLYKLHTIREFCFDTTLKQASSLIIQERESRDHTDKDGSRAVSGNIYEGTGEQDVKRDKTRVEDIDVTAHHAPLAERQQRKENSGTFGSTLVLWCPHSVCYRDPGQKHTILASHTILEAARKRVRIPQNS